MIALLVTATLQAVLGIPTTEPAPSADPRSPRLKVSDNRRFLVKADGTPFFYLGDTAWELFHRLDRAETELYLKDRADKGFTVIQAVVLAEFNGLNEPNRFGEKPLIDNDPTRPNEAYFKHVDWVVARAAELGLQIGMLPTWGDKVNKKWGVGPVVFNPDNARVFGAFLGRRYKDQPIIWILGGDRPVESDEHRAIWDRMALGLHEGDGGGHLSTYHPSGYGTSSKWFHDSRWLDFNMIQSGHGALDIPNYDMIAADHARTPAKPVLDGEPRYEDHPIAFKAERGWFDAYDVRKAVYWSLFAGACGVTFGCHDIWQFLDTDRHPPVTAARTPWREALALPASTQVGHARRLLESRPFLSRVPDQSLIVGDAGKGGEHIQATRDESGSYALIYIPVRKDFTIDLEKLRGDRIKASWFDPRTGQLRRIETIPRKGKRAFSTPAEGPDWVLVLDDAAQNFPDPAKP